MEILSCATGFLAGMCAGIIIGYLLTKRKKVTYTSTLFKEGEVTGSYTIYTKEELEKMHKAGSISYTGEKK